LNKLANEESSAEHPLQTAANSVFSHIRKVPPEVMAGMPKDGASQHDHYNYGWPQKRVVTVVRRHVLPVVHMDNFRCRAGKEGNTK